MSFKQKQILMKTFVESQFEVIEVDDFQTKLNSYEHICWVSGWSYVSLWVSNKIELLWRHLVSLSLKLCKFMRFNPKQIRMKTFVKSQFECMLVCDFQRKANSSEDISWASVWSYLSLWVSKKSKFLWGHLLSLSLKLCKFMSFKEKRILTKTYFRSQFELI